VPLALIDQLYAGLVAAEVPRFDGVRAPAWWRALLAVTYNTGLRAGTLFRLRMSDVDFGAHRLQVRAGANKSRKTFYVPLNATALAHLVTIRTDRELVFPWPFTRDWFYETFHRLQAAAAIPSDQHFGLHALRRTLATALYATSPAAAQLALGHSSVKTTEAFYVGQAAVVAPALDALPQPSAFAAAASALEAQTGAA
jgi:integrase